MRERTLAPYLTLVDIDDGLVWHRDGGVTLAYVLQAFHEPSFSEAGFDRSAFDCENALGVLPEGTTLQFLVFVDRDRGRRLVQEAWPAVADDHECHEVLGAFHAARARQLLKADTSAGVPLAIQERRHFLAATFRPQVLDLSLSRRAARWWDDVRRAIAAGDAASALLGLARLRRSTAPHSRLHHRILEEARAFHDTVSAALHQMGLAHRRCTTEDLVGLAFEVLNPTASEAAGLHRLSGRARAERDGLPSPVTQEYPYAADSPPTASLLVDDLVVHPSHLVLGGRHVGVVSLKELPDRTEPGLVVPLLRLTRRRYVVSYRIHVPRAGLTLATLRARARWAAGAKLKNLFVQNNQEDPQARLIEDQSLRALERVIGSTQRIYGTSLRIALFEDSLEALREAQRLTISQMAHAHGLCGYPESYLLLESLLSFLPGAPEVAARLRKTLTPVTVDLLPVWDFPVGEGRIPFTTPNASLVLLDPFDTKAVPNPHIVILGTPGAGKSVAANYILSSYDVAAAARREPMPYTFILDNGASYRRYCEIRPDGRYLAFSADEPPAFDPFSWSPKDGKLDEHIGRLEELWSDLLRVPQDDTRAKATLEAALGRIYRAGDFEASVDGFDRALAAVDPAGTEALRRALYPYAEGKFAGLLRPRESPIPKGAHLVCFDFKGLEGSKDLAGVALRLAIYEIRRFAGRISALGHRLFLVLDESWAMLDRTTGGQSFVAAAAPYLVSTIRMGRKHGMCVILLSQNVEDWAESGYGAAILGNMATKLVGLTGDDGRGVARHLDLAERQLEQVRRLARTREFHEFLLLRGQTSEVVRVPLDPFSRWVFTTKPDDLRRLEDVRARHPDLNLLERLRLLAAEA